MFLYAPNLAESLLLDSLVGISQSCWCSDHDGCGLETFLDWETEVLRRLGWLAVAQSPFRSTCSMYTASVDTLSR